MKFEKLTDDKLRIIFTVKDMSANNVSTETFLSNNTVSQKLLHALLLRAEEKVGFKTDDCNLLVEAISFSDGGFIFTITKLSSSATNEDSKLLFKFENFDNFLEFCTYMKNTSFSDYDRFSLFLYKNTYYLSVFGKDDWPINLKSILCEFGKPISYSPRNDWYS